MIRCVSETLLTSSFNLNIQSQLPYLLWLGTNGLVAMVFLQLALEREKAGRVGILRTSNVIFAYLFQILFTNDQGNSRNIVEFQTLF